MQLLSDYHFHKSENKNKSYFSDNNIWWSNELKKWMCTNPSLIKTILNEPKFGVHTYQVKAIEEKTKSKFTYISEIISYFPLAFEGEAHKEMRKSGAQNLAERLNLTLEVFKADIIANLARIRHANDGIDFYTEVLEPSVKKALLHMAGLESLANHSIISISQLFDQAISIKKRVEINDQIATLLNALPESMSTDDKYFKLSLFAIGYDSLLGSLTESLVRTLQQNEHKTFNQIKWSSELPNTGVPVIERVAKEEITLGGVVINAGQKVRLYLESAGFQHSENSLYSSLFFGHGIHKCIGLHLSNAIWQIFVEELTQIDRHFEIKHLHYRTEDYVFNIFDEIKVTFYD